MRGDQDVNFLDDQQAMALIKNARGEEGVGQSRQEMMGEFFKPVFGDAVFGPDREKLPPLSGPVTLKDGSVIKPADYVNHPQHYTNGPECPHCGSTIECITITEGMGFCLGNTVKYIWRKDAKGKALEDLKKARWYLDREIQRMEERCER